jgi:heme exporter protein B
MTGAFLDVVRRDIAIAVRAGGGFGLALVFFISVVAVVPFAVGPDLNLLGRIGPAILWIGALLASLIGLDRLFGPDYEDGSLDMLMMGGLPLPLLVAAKALAHWLVIGLPLALAAPVLGLLLNLPPPAFAAVALTLLIGTPALTMIGAVGAALTVSLRRGGLIVPVLVLPIGIPILIFGMAATGAAISGPVAFSTPFQVLCGLSLASLVLAPLAAAAALRGSQA